MKRLIVDDVPISFEDGDSILIAMLRAGEHPTGGGCLCLGGDCPNCLATVDGVSYVRTCQTAAKPGMMVQKQPHGEYPPLVKTMHHDAETPARNLHCDVVVIGAGESGQAAAAEAEAAGKTVMLLDTGTGQEAVGIYAGPLVVVRTEGEMLHIHAHEEVIVATGAAEIQPVAPGSHLQGLLTARATEQVAAAGISLGHVAAIGNTPNGVNATAVSGRVVRFEGENGKLTAVVTADDDGNETHTPCDTVSLGLGLHPRDALRRMGHDLAVRAVGDAALESDIPPCPLAGTVCVCSGVTVDDLDQIWDRGFHEMELVKRGTLAGTGTCQGSACLPHLRSYLAEKGKTLQPPFTARPVTRQLTMGEIAAGAHHHATAKTALDAEHRRLGGNMQRSAGWWRPWNYGNVQEEYWAVREAVSIMDVSTLGKMIVSGPDALEFLERLYPTKVRTIKDGRSRYVLLLNERGYLMDDGMICKESDTRYSLTFTSGGSSHSEMWLRDWATSWGMDVRLINQTHRLAAINVTGPLTNELLALAGLENPPAYLRHTAATIADVDCHVYRLSFTGELSYELHVPAENAAKLWRALLRLGRPLGIKPHGLEVLRLLRLEKGHIIIGQDTDMDSTPRRIHHEWAVKLDKDDFIGKTMVEFNNDIPLDKQLVGLEMDSSEAPMEGATIYSQDGDYSGYVTSSGYSPVLGKSVMLAWLYLEDGKLPSDVTIEGKTAVRAHLPFYDKEASRARA